MSRAQHDHFCNALCYYYYKGQCELKQKKCHAQCKEYKVIKKEVTGQCSKCGNKIMEGAIGLCSTCFKKKYHHEPTDKGKNY